MNPLNRKLYRDLLHMRGQVIATAIVVACGVASFVAMRSTYDSLLASRDTYYSQYQFADVFAGLKRAPKQAAAEISRISGVATVQTRVSSAVTLDLPNMPEPALGKVVSLPEGKAASLNNHFLLRGRAPEPNKNDEVVVSGAFADANGLHPGDSITAVLNGRWRRLNIVGVALSPEYIYEIRPGDIFPDNRRFGIIWMNSDAAEAAFQMKDAFNDLTLTLAPGASEASVIQEVDRILEPFGGFGAYGRGDQNSHRFITNELGELEVFGTFIPAIFLGVTAFLLHLVLSRLVSVEREQIGLLKAFGYSNMDVGLHYLKMALAAVVGGVVLGIALGAWLGSAMNRLYGEFFHFPIMEFFVGPGLILWSFVISFASASIGAASAVRRAVALPPAEAMRPEPPASYHAGFFESLGFQRFLSPEARIIVRNIVRQPIKAGLSALGISLSVALLFVGFYFFDAINKIVSVQFSHVMREDVEVTFYEPRPGRVVHELAALPGVRRVETYRTVPARIRFGNRSRRVGIAGIEPTNELRRIVDQDLRVITLPPEGLVLGKTLADSLGIKSGDRVMIEVTEGVRPVRDVQVVKIVDELIGLSSYMDLHALNRMMNEENTVSGAYLSVDENLRSNLYSILKKTPAVAGVSLPDSTLESFNETIARTIGTSTTFLIGFACVIAFGVVYTGARIALAERGRELASLRVLGFTRKEIGVMLLGEQALLTAAAIPLGWAIGFALSVLITRAVDVEIVRLPVVFSSRTFVLSFLLVVVAALISGLIVSRRVRTMDLIEVLKTRE